MERGIGEKGKEGRKAEEGRKRDGEMGGGAGLRQLVQRPCETDSFNFSGIPPFPLLSNNQTSRKRTCFIFTDLPH